MINNTIRDAIIDEMEENRKLHTKVENAVRDKYLYKILEKTSDYERYLEIYDIKENLKAKGIELQQIDNVDEIKEKWDKYFTSHISKELKDKIYYNQFKWHIFSSEVLLADKEDDADSAFFETEKGGAFLCGQLTEECFEINDVTNFGKRELELIHEMLDDFCLFDINGKWTYICTHEEDFGPYFYQLK